LTVEQEMKSDHRHELKTNELAEWIANLPQWAKENRNTIIIVIVVLVAAAGVYLWRTYNRRASARQQFRLTSLMNSLSNSQMQVLQGHSQGRDLSFVLLQPAEQLKTFAQNTTDNQMAALALIKRAQALRMELHYRLETVGRQDLISQINQAKASYTEALEKASGNPSLQAMAKFGLGLCEEELGNFDEARRIYQEVAADPAFEGTAAKTAAQNRLQTVEDYKTKVVFRPSPKPKPPVASLPTTGTAPGEPNMPVGANLPIETILPADIAPPIPNAPLQGPEVNVPPPPPNDVPDVAETNLPGS
jgi:tetratricopeptide (TPR) repeat protein